MDNKKVETVLKEIFDKCGTEIVQNRKKFISAVYDLLDEWNYKDERIVLKFAMESDAIPILLSTPQITSDAAERAVEQIRKETHMDGEDATFVVQCVVAARGFSSDIVTENEKRRQAEKIEQERIQKEEEQKRQKELRKQKREEKERKEEEQKRKEEEQKRREEEQKRQEEERKQREEQRRQEEEQKRQEEERKQREEQKRQEEERKQREEQKRQEEERRQKEEQKKREEEQKKQEEEKKQKEEQKQWEEEQKRRQREEEQKQQEETDIAAQNSNNMNDKSKMKRILAAVPWAMFFWFLAFVIILIIFDEEFCGAGATVFAISAACWMQKVQKYMGFIKRFIQSVLWGIAAFAVWFIILIIIFESAIGSSISEDEFFWICAFMVGFVFCWLQERVLQQTIKHKKS